MDYYSDYSDTEFDYIKQAELKKNKEKEKKMKKQQQQQQLQKPSSQSETSSNSQQQTRLVESCVTKQPVLNGLSTSASQRHLLDLVNQFQDKNEIKPSNIFTSMHLIPNIITVGNVDAGKSTIFGHLCQLLDQDEKKLQQLQEISTQLKKPSFAYAYYLDTNDQERERGVTMTVNSYYMDIEGKYFLFQDCPGHLDFSDSIFTQVLRPDCGVLVVESTNFDRLQDNILQHLYFLILFAVKKIIVVINKMDKVDFSKTKFDEIVTKVTQLFDSIQQKTKVTLDFIPVSGLSEKDSNIVEYTQKMNFAQSTLKQQLLTVKKDNYKIKQNNPIALILDCYIDNGNITASIFLDQGILSVDDIIFSSPSLIMFKVIEISTSAQIDSLAPNQQATVILQPYIKQVDKLRVASDPKQAFYSIHKGDSIELAGSFLNKKNLIQISKKIRAQILIINNAGLCLGDDIEIFVGIQRMEGQVNKIDALWQKGNFLTTNSTFVLKNQLASIVFNISNEVVCLKFEQSKIFGRIVLRKGVQMIGFGYVIGIKKNSQATQ